MFIKKNYTFSSFPDVWFWSNFVCSWGTPSLYALSYGNPPCCRYAIFMIKKLELLRQFWLSFVCSWGTPSLYALPYGHSPCSRYAIFMIKKLDLLRQFWLSFVCSWGTPSLYALPYGRCWSRRYLDFYENMRVRWRQTWSIREAFLRNTCFSLNLQFEVERAFPIWESIETGGLWEREICKRNSCFSEL